MKIMMVSVESLPFVKVGGLADVVYSLSKAYSQRQDVEVCIFLPFLRQVRDFCETNKIQLLEKPFFLWEKSFLISARLLEAQYEGVSFFFVDIPQFFDREFPYGTSLGDYVDNFSRFSAFCQVVFSCLNDFQTDIVHLHDWPSSLLAYYVSKYSYYLHKSVRSVLTIHNIAYQGVFPSWTLQPSLIQSEDFIMDRCEFYGQVNWLKLGIFYSHKITTVSETYAQEVMEDKGCQLEFLLRRRRYDFEGICNGLDKELFSPTTDSSIVPYDSTNLDNKLQNKKDLLGELYPDMYPPSTLLIGMVSRIVSQKGFDIILQSLAKMAKRDILFVVIGVGDYSIENELKQACESFNWMRYLCCYDSKKASQIYAASDIFLMPSEFEPCGLSQLIAMSYGSLPLVTPTGGLFDTVEPILGQEVGSGFVMDGYDSESLIVCIDKAVDLYYNHRLVWNRCLRYAMTLDFSWEKRVDQYVRLYHCSLK